MTQTNDLHICSKDRISTFTSSAGEMLIAVLNGALSVSADIKKDGLSGTGDWLIQEEISVYKFGSFGFPSFRRHSPRR